MFHVEASTQRIEASARHVEATTQRIETTTHRPVATTGKIETTARRTVATTRRIEITARRPVATTRRVEITRRRPVATTRRVETTKRLGKVIPFQAEATTCGFELAKVHPEPITIFLQMSNRQEPETLPCGYSHSPENPRPTAGGTTEFWVSHGDPSRQNRWNRTAAGRDSRHVIMQRPAFHHIFNIVPQHHGGDSGEQEPVQHTGQQQDAATPAARPQQLPADDTSEHQSEKINCKRGIKVRQHQVAQLHRITANIEPEQRGLPEQCSNQHRET